MNASVVTKWRQFSRHINVKCPLRIFVVDISLNILQLLWKHQCQRGLHYWISLVPNLLGFIAETYIHGKHPPVDFCSVVEFVELAPLLVLTFTVFPAKTFRTITFVPSLRVEAFPSIFAYSFEAIIHFYIKPSNKRWLKGYNVFLISPYIISP